MPVRGEQLAGIVNCGAKGDPYAFVVDVEDGRSGGVTIRMRADKKLVKKGNPIWLSLDRPSTLRLIQKIAATPERSELTVRAAEKIANSK